jgi:hypothetical protein
VNGESNDSPVLALNVVMFAAVVLSARAVVAPRASVAVATPTHIGFLIVFLR